MHRERQNATVSWPTTPASRAEFTRNRPARTHIGMFSAAAWVVYTVRLASVQARVGYHAGFGVIRTRTHRCSTAAALSDATFNPDPPFTPPTSTPNTLSCTYCGGLRVAGLVGASWGGGAVFAALCASRPRSGAIAHADGGVVAASNCSTNRNTLVSHGTIYANLSVRLLAAAGCC